MKKLFNPVVAIVAGIIILPFILFAILAVEYSSALEIFRSICMTLLLYVIIYFVLPEEKLNENPNDKSRKRKI